MAFNQFKLDRATTQSRGIFDTFVYSTDDTIAEVQATGYFSQSRYATRTPDKWTGSFVTCKCADGVFEGEIDSNGTAQPIAGGEADGDVVGPESSIDRSISIFSGTTGKVVDEAPIIVDTDGRMTFTSLDDIKGSMVGVDIYEIFEASDLDDLATGGIITVSSITIFIWKNIATEIESDVRIVCESGGRFQVQAGGGRMVWIYTGTDTFISGDGAFTAIDMTLQSNSGSAKFIDLGTRALLLKDAGVRGWNDLGEFYGGVVTMNGTRFIANSTTLTLRNCSNIDIESMSPIALFPGLSLITILNQFAKSASIKFVGCSGEISSTASLMRLDPAILDGSRALITNCTISGGQLFDTSGISGVFTAASDSSIALTTVTSVSDSSGLARFNHAGTDVFAGQMLELTGFSVSSYNTSSRIVSNAGVGYFEFESVDYNGDSSGSFEAESVTLTETATAISEGDTVVVDTALSTDYDGGSFVYNKQVNSFQINRAFTTDHSGTWSAEGLDHKDPRVLASTNPNFTASNTTACAYVNGNTTETTSITNEVFKDLALGTVGDAMNACSTIERWKLIDEVNCTFECTSNEPVSGEIIFDITGVSSGSAQVFRVKFVVDRGAGFVDLDDPVEAALDIGGTASSASKHTPFSVVKGDLIKPQITREAGNSDITISYFTVSTNKG